MVSPKLEHYTFMVDLFGCAGPLQEAENMIKVMPINHMRMCGRFCWALVEFMVMLRWENVLGLGFLNWSLKILGAVCWYQTSMLLLATGISVRKLNGRERREV
jgi:hypothetical protein